MIPGEELRDTLYAAFNTIATCVLYIFNMAHYKKKKELQTPWLQYITAEIVKSKYKRLSNILPVLFVLAESLLFSYFQYPLSGSTNGWMGEIANTGTNYYGLITFSPVFVCLLSCILWVNPLKQEDLITPVYPLALVLSKIACTFAGCCHGMQWANGLYNYKYDRYEVPIQLIEAGVALLIFFFLLWWRKKAKTGTMYPTYVIVYSGIRFFTEFMRGEENTFGPLKTYHILCLIGIAYGILMLVVVHFFGEKINILFDTTVYGKKGDALTVLQVVFNPYARKAAKKKRKKDKARAARAKAKAEYLAMKEQKK